MSDETCAGSNAGVAIGLRTPPNYVVCPQCGNSVWWHTLNRTEGGDQIVQLGDHPAKPTRTVVNRILWNERGECIDEIVIGASTVHVEQMNERCWWIGIDVAGGGYWAGNFFADSRGRMRFTEQDQDGFEWDDDKEHIR